jgi:hypothetical protein
MLKGAPQIQKLLYFTQARESDFHEFYGPDRSGATSQRTNFLEIQD